ncbi:RidA family protein [Demequina lignilytica]|uniref:RidA family protein n=1 Tax=Demequina lignilytica TaxID=3051663 RepID=A0AB35MGS9_9MICO|nr:RidA family protein [Demequina sp. SYSU T0a273]MDN4482979.1 RidA family protein [Demequina sp. SYSU T0a273]
MPRRESIDLDGFAHANPIPAASRIGPLLFSGVLTGRDAATGTMPATLDEQCVAVFARVRELMHAAGGSTDHIAKMTFWLADYRDRAALNREWLAMFPDPASRPARQAMAASLDGGCLIQCDLVAVMDDAGGAGPASP